MSILFLANYRTIRHNKNIHQLDGGGGGYGVDTESSGRTKHIDVALVHDVVAKAGIPNNESGAYFMSLGFFLEAKFCLVALVVTRLG